VQVGTFNFVEPASSERIATELEEYCRQNSISDVGELVGGMKTD
jgi:dihydroorotate dehydrogenase